MRTTAGPRQVPAIPITKGLAINPLPVPHNMGGWAVTHMSSGMVVAYCCCETQARYTAEVIAPHADWTQPYHLLCGVRFSRRMLAVADEHYIALQTRSWQDWCDQCRADVRTEDIDVDTGWIAALM